jgi:hypothetical protein
MGQAWCLTESVSSDVVLYLPDVSDVPCFACTLLMNKS